MSQRKTAIAVGIPASNHSTSPPVVRPDSSVRRTARIVGVLFLAGYLAYGVGSLIAKGIVRSGDRSDSTALFVTGAALMLLNSAFVIGIGVLMFPILRPHNKAIAAGYLGTRIFEGVVLAIGVVSLIVLTGSAPPSTRTPSATTSPRPGSVSEASSSALCSSAPDSFRVSWLPGVSSATRASPGATCWSCSASRAPRSSAPSPVDCSS